MKQSSAKKFFPQKYRHKQKLMSKMSYSESEPDFSNFAIIQHDILALLFSESKSESHDSKSDFN